jgi:uncharacterized membrane protein YeaQ/YmgE (transglycosylase-associated protein family)
MLTSNLRMLSGRQSDGFLLTTVLGIAGVFAATFIVQTIGWYRLDQGAGLIGATVGAWLIVLFAIPQRPQAPARVLAVVLPGRTREASPASELARDGTSRAPLSPIRTALRCPSIVQPVVNEFDHLILKIN